MTQSARSPEARFPLRFYFYSLDAPAKQITRLFEQLV